MTATTTSAKSLTRIAARLTLTGRVQGIGMRPAVARFAEQLSLAGYVTNTNGGVEIHVEGAAQDVDRFERELREHLPNAAEISSLRSLRVESLEFGVFLVGPVVNLANHAADQGDLQAGSALSARVPPDVVVCDHCLSEVRTTADRRHGYAFTSCTDCGPRYSIVGRMPYEREQTSMAAFPLCTRCRGEYESPGDRRFHAQTNACPECGPQIWLRRTDGTVIARGHDAPRAAASAILDDRIVALRGLGGYQLLVDATSREAVERLRQRKQRPGKPLAVMVPSPREAAKLARLDETERAVLRSPPGPIVVAVARGETRIAPSVTAGLNTIGLMLPTTPLHWLLLEQARRPIVCTSGNLEGDPLACEADAALDQLRGIADVCLEHDRPIRRPIDDSVVRVMAGRPVTIRLARGYAPRALEMDSNEPLIALGNHQKAAIALSNGAQAVLGPHLGDLDTVAARQRLVEQTADLSELYGLECCPLVCDQHPQCFTTEWADIQAPGAVRVQHHHAHVVAGMLEHGWLGRQVLGVAFDGTGYGTDGTIWGGEILLATATSFKRVGHLRPFTLAGGERAIRQPWRVATAIVRDAAGDDEAAKLVFHTGNAASVLPVLQRTRLSQMTTSAGRLFDGVASLVLGVEQCLFEGQAAMLLESACDLAAAGQYDFRTNGTQLDWRLLVRQILRDRSVGVSPGAMAMRFHRGLANALLDVCRRFSPLPVVLSGGVFQNRVLVELVADRFADTNQPLGLPGMIPPNDGGLAAGQLAVAAALARQRRTNSCV